MPADPLRVSVLAYDGCLGTEIFGLADLLLIAERVARGAGIGRDLFDVSLVGRTKRVQAAGGFELRTDRWHGDVDVLVVPGFDLRAPSRAGSMLQRWRPEVSFIADAARDGVAVASVCVGAFLLGEARLLDGRRATTSWLFARELAARYPRAVVDPESMIVSDGPVTTTAAFSAVHDLALRLIRQHAGDDVTRLTARVALVADNRSSQSPYVDDQLLDTRSTQFARGVQAWLVARLDEPYDLGALARAFNVSTRTLLRRFRAEAGCSPLDFLHVARVNAAKRLLEDPDSSVASVMHRVGYADAGTFRRLFARHVGQTPASYRRQFTSRAVARV